MPLTRAILQLLGNLFWFSGRFSNFKNEEHALFYIRMHYLSFLKLYNGKRAQRHDGPMSVSKTMAVSATFSLNDSEAL
jgi:hypothetical protein